MEQMMSHQRKKLTVIVATRFVSLLFCLLLVPPSVALYGQTPESLPEIKQKVRTMLAQNRYTEAVPLLEKIVAAEPNESDGHYYLATALLGLIANTSDEAVKKQLRLRARAEFLKAKELGTK